MLSRSGGTKPRVIFFMLGLSIVGSSDKCNSRTCLREAEGLIGLLVLFALWRRELQE
jgi:hypothetical protein